MHTGQATWDEGLLLFLERKGFREETYHTFSYSPVPDDRGGVGGMLCVVTEDTERTIGERRLRTLRELAARTTDVARSVEEACQTAARILAGNPHDLPFALLYLLDDDGSRATLVAATGVDWNTPISPAAVDLNDIEGRLAVSQRRRVGPGRRGPRPAGEVRHAAGRRLAGAVAAGGRPADGEAGADAARRVRRGRASAPAGRSTTAIAGSSTCWPVRSPPPSPTPGPTRKSGGGPRRWPSSTGPRPPSSPTSATSSAPR